MKAQINVLIGEGKFEEAQALCKTLCKRTPGDAEALFLAGAVDGQLGNFAAAETALRRALAIVPDHPVINYNLGVALFRQQRFEQAIKLFARTVQLDKNKFEAWMLLGQANEAIGAGEDAQKAYVQAVSLYPASQEALHALGGIYLKSGLWADASNAYARLLKLVPADPFCIKNLGIALSRSYQFDRLVTLLEPIALASPEAIEANAYVAMAHIELGETEAAEKFYNRVLDADPDNIDSRVGLAMIHNLRGDYELALEFIEPLTNEHPVAPVVALGFAAIAPRFKLSGRAIELLEPLVDNLGLSTLTRARAAVALGTLWDKQGDYDRAFHHIRRGNELSGAKFDRDNLIKSIEMLERLYAEDSIAALPVSGSASEQPIFIVGMPRSGTTLVEQILASHSQVFGAGELKYIQNICFELNDMQINGKAFPFCLTDVSPEQLLCLGRDYLARLDVLSGHAPRVTDKIPTNHLYLGLIYQLFPKAKVIHVTRDPLDTCVSCYCQFFSGAYPYTYDLDDLGFYYRSYERLMRRWNKVLPMAILNVSYEDLVCNQTDMTRKLLDFCDLPWEPACLEFHKTRRTVATASSDQVRRPMYTGAIGKWRRYERHVGALVSALEKYS